MQRVGAPFFASSREDKHYWRDHRQQRTIIGSRIGADQFSPNALRLAIPIAAAMWMTVAMALHGYL